MRKLLMLMIALFTVSIFAGGKHSTAQAAGKKIQKIGVVSLLRDEFHSVYIGTTIFQNKTNFKRTSGWRMSRSSEAVLIKAIRKNKKYTVRKARYNKSSLLKINLKSMGAFSSSEPYRNELQNIGKKQKFDLLLVISPVTLDQPLFKFNKIGEYGHYHLYSAILSDHLCTFVKYRLSIYDVKNNEIKDSRFTTSTKYGMGSSACSDKIIGGVASRLPEGYSYKDSFSAYPSSQIKTMKTRVKKQLHALLKKDAECLQLAPLKNGKFREDGCGIFE